MADPAERLYGLPLEQFTAERDKTARELRRAGDRDGAAVVAKLPKPTPAAWAANRVARERPELVRALLDAGAALRDAQASAVAGAGARALREAAAAERGAVDAVMAVAAALRPAGRPLSRAMADRLRATLHAAAADEDVRTALAEGRLASEAQAGGAWPLAGAPAAPEEAPALPRPAPARAAGTPAARRRAGEKPPAPAPEPDRAAERRALERALREARGALRVRERAATAAERDAAAAERAASAAQERLRRAQAAADDARAEAEAATAALDEARAALAKTRDDVARLEERLD